MFICGHAEFYSSGRDHDNLSDKKKKSVISKFYNASFKMGFGPQDFDPQFHNCKKIKK